MWSRGIFMVRAFSFIHIFRFFELKNPILQYYGEFYKWKKVILPY